MLGIDPDLISLKSFENYQHDNERSVEFRVFPNPTTGNILVQYVGTDLEYATFNIEIFDVFGKFLQSLELNETEVSISLDNYSQGIYFYRISSLAGIVQYGKIMKL
jgi:hypothetical protein